jgi:archaellum biogenesis ATPase FlaH
MGNISSYSEQIFFHYILDHPIFLNSTKPEFFTNPTLKDLFDIAKEHALKYKESPSKAQLHEIVQIKGLGEKYSNDVITALYNAKNQLKEYDETWLEENIGPWIQVRNLDHVMRKSIAYIKTSSITVENASNVVETVRHMMTTETAIDFSFNLGTDFFDPTSHTQERLARTSTGYSYVDKCLNGGWWKGSLIVFLGAGKIGKSFWMCNLAANSVYNGYNTAYITLELQREIVAMRIGSNMLNIPIDNYEEVSKDQDLLKKKLTKLKRDSLKPLGALHIKEFPSSTMSTNDLRTYLVKAQDLLGYKFENVFIDYINIMKNWRNPNTENLYMKIKQICEDLRATAQEEHWAIITPTQTTRCLDINTIIEHRENGKIKLKNIKIGDFILGDCGYVKVKNIWNNNNIKTYKIKTKLGKEIICSENHIFPSEGEFKKVSELWVGSKIYIKK